MWGLSVVERLLDRLTAFDSATTGAAQLLFKAYLRVIGVEGLRDALAIGGKDEEAVIKQFELIRQFQSIEGITLLDAEDAFHTYAYNFNGIAEILQQFERQISGALDMPIVRLFGMSPAGLNATGESDIRNYYDGITQQKEIQLRPGVQTLLNIISHSEFGRPLGEDFTFSFNPLWQMSEKEKAELFRDDMNAFAVAHDTGILQDWQILAELQRLAAKSGRGTTITEKDIDAAKKKDIPPSFEEKGAMWGEIINRADKLITGGGVANVTQGGEKQASTEPGWYWKPQGETVKTQEAASAEVQIEVKQEILSKIDDFARKQEDSLDYRPDQKRAPEGVSEGGQFIKESEGENASGAAFNRKEGTISGAEIITSQDYIDDDIVDEKIQNNDFDVTISPEFEYGGKKLVAIIDGHHSLAAAIKAGKDPVFHEADKTEHDAIGLLEQGNVEDFLEAIHMGSDYKNAVTNRGAFDSNAGVSKDDKPNRPSVSHPQLQEVIDRMNDFLSGNTEDYRPDQKRIEKGKSEGGQFAEEGEGGQSSSGESEKTIANKSKGNAITKSRIEKLSRSDTERLTRAYDINRMSNDRPDFEEIADNQGFSPSARTAIKPLFNKFVEADLDPHDARHIMNGEYGYNEETVKFYIEHLGERNRGITGENLAKEMQVGDVDGLRTILRGLSAKYPKLLNYSDTHDLDKLTIDNFAKWQSKESILKEIDNFLNNNTHEKFVEGGDSKHDIITMVEDFLKGLGNTKDQSEELVLDKIRAFMGELDASLDYRPDQTRHPKGVPEGGEYANEGRGYAAGSEFAKKYGKSSSRGGGHSKTPSPAHTPSPQPAPSPSPAPAQQTGKQPTTPAPTATPAPAQQGGTPPVASAGQNVTQESKTVEEAQQRAAAMGTFADYKGFDIKMANIANDVLEKTQQEFPKIPLPAVGSKTSASVDKLIRRSLFDFDTEYDIKRVEKTLMNERAVAFLSRRIAKATGEVKYLGIFCSRDMAKNSKKYQAAKERDALSGWDSGSSDNHYMSHEMGHYLDRHVGLQNTQEMHDLYNNVVKGDANGEKLAGYAASKKFSEERGIREMIAEGWAEYQNSTSPRPVAKQIGEAMIRAYQQKYGKG